MMNGYEVHGLDDYEEEEGDDYMIEKYRRLMATMELRRLIIMK